MKLNLFYVKFHVKLQMKFLIPCKISYEIYISNEFSHEILLEISSDRASLICRTNLVRVK